MAEVPDYLVPTDGLTNSSVRFAGLDTISGKNGARVKFDIFDEDEEYVATFAFDVGPQPEETIDSIVAEAHRRMRDMIRQWLHDVDVMHRHYSKQTPGSTIPNNK